MVHVNDEMRLFVHHSCVRIVGSLLLRKELEMRVVGNDLLCS